jgi:hypothetical protein
MRCFAAAIGTLAAAVMLKTLTLCNIIYIYLFGCLYANKS